MKADCLQLLRIAGANCNRNCNQKNEAQEEKIMTDQQLLSRITVNPKVMVGKPAIKGTRLTVEHILNLLAHGTTVQEILKEYDGLTQDDIQACLLFATRSLEDTTFMPLAESA